jgi:hypothetical protein
MNDTLTEAHETLDGLRALATTTVDADERKGLEAFIECVSPHLMGEATATFLGKIASIVMTDAPKDASAEETIAALSEHFDVTVE